MARIDKGLVTLVGRDRENPRTHRDAFQITGGLGEVLDKHIKRNNLNKSEFIREAIAAKLEAEMPTEPRIKDEKIRKAVRAFWETIPDVVTDKRILYKKNHDFAVGIYSIYCGEIYPETLEVGKMYTITELCGEEEG